MHQRDPDGCAYNVVMAFRLRGAVDAVALRVALRRAVARHPALRTAFEAAPDGPHQVVAEPYDPWSGPGTDRDDGGPGTDRDDGRRTAGAWWPGACRPPVRPVPAAHDGGALAAREEDGEGGRTAACCCCGCTTSRSTAGRSTCSSVSCPPTTPPPWPTADRARPRT
ncbi:hypothetical protein NKH77_06310 [Streptomyces sp. M19]